MTLRTALRLGRVSNLPTVWTNVMAGLALNGGALEPRLIVPLGLATSLFYVAGMYINDAFDWRWDAQHRPERPIPAGEVKAGTVFAAGFGVMAAGLVLLARERDAFAERLHVLGHCGLVAALGERGLAQQQVGCTESQDAGHHHVASRYVHESPPRVGSTAGSAEA